MVSRKTCVVLRAILVQLMEDWKAGSYASLHEACKGWARQKKEHGMMVPKNMLASPKAKAKGKAAPKTGAKAKAKPKPKSEAAAKSSANGTSEEDEDGSSSSSASSD